MSITQSFKTPRPNATIITYIFKLSTMYIRTVPFISTSICIYKESGNNTQNFLKIWVIIHSNFKYRYFICIYTESHIYSKYSVYTKIISWLFLNRLTENL